MPKACRSFSRVQAAPRPEKSLSHPLRSKRIGPPKKLLEFQAKAKALNVEALREELRKANLPETRLDEFLSASEEIIRNYQAAVDTLAAVINKESQRISSASSESIPLPKERLWPYRASGGSILEAPIRRRRCP